MKSNNLVSIIMTCNNGELFLQQAVKSIINQTYSNWELIFYDNSSQDKSEEILKNFKDHRIKFFRSNKLLNLGSIRKLAYSECKGFFISFLDVDDYWSENKLQKQINKFEIDNSLDVIYTNYCKIQNHIVTKNKVIMHRGYCQNKIILSYVRGSPLTTWLTLMIKKSSIDKLEYSFDDKTHIASDFDLIIRLSVFCNFDYINEYLAYYRLHQNNESKNKIKEIDELIYIINKYKKNKKISSSFHYKNFIYKIYIKYLLYKKLNNDYSKNNEMIESMFINIIYFAIKITPKK